MRKDQIKQASAPPENIHAGITGNERVGETFEEIQARSRKKGETKADPATVEASE